MKFVVKTLQAAIRELHDEASSPNSLFSRGGQGRGADLSQLISRCDADLRKLKHFLIKYNSLKTKNPRTRDRIAFTPSKVQDIRNKLSSHTEKLNLFLTQMNTSALGRIEMKLDLLLEDVLCGRKDPALLTMAEDSELLEKELLEDDAITEVDVELNKDTIKEWLRSHDDGQVVHQPQSKAETQQIADGCFEQTSAPTFPNNEPSQNKWKQYHARVEDCVDDDNHSVILSDGGILQTDEASHEDSRNEKEESNLPSSSTAETKLQNGSLANSFQSAEIENDNIFTQLSGSEATANGSNNMESVHSSEFPQALPHSVRDKPFKPYYSVKVEDSSAENNMPGSLQKAAQNVLPVDRVETSDNRCVLDEPNERASDSENNKTSGSMCNPAHPDRIEASPFLTSDHEDLDSSDKKIHCNTPRPNRNSFTPSLPLKNQDNKTKAFQTSESFSNGSSCGGRRIQPDFSRLSASASAVRKFQSKERSLDDMNAEIRNLEAELYPENQKLRNQQTDKVRTPSLDKIDYLNGIKQWHIRLQERTQVELKSRRNISEKYIGLEENILYHDRHKIKEESYNLVNFFVSPSGLTYDNTWDGHSQYTDPTPQSAPFLENFWSWGMDPWIAGRPSCPLNPCHPRHSIPLPPQHLPPLPSAKRDSQPGEHLPGQGSGGKLSSPTSESMPLGLKSESESESESEFETTIYEKILPCTLEELFNGTTKKLKIKTRAYDQAVEKTFLVEKILNVPVRRGLGAGAKIKFRSVGDYVPGEGKQDIHFIIQEVS